MAFQGSRFKVYVCVYCCSWEGCKPPDLSGIHCIYRLFLHQITIIDLAPAKSARLLPLVLRLSASLFKCNYAIHETELSFIIVKLMWGCPTPFLPQIQNKT